MISTTRKMQFEKILMFVSKVIRPKRGIGSKKIEKIFFFLRSQIFSKFFFAFYTEFYADLDDIIITLMHIFMAY